MSSDYENLLICRSSTCLALNNNATCHKTCFIHWATALQSLPAEDKMTGQNYNCQDLFWENKVTAENRMCGGLKYRTDWRSKKRRSHSDKYKTYCIYLKHVDYWHFCLFEQLIHCLLKRLWIAVHWIRAIVFCLFLSPEQIWSKAQHRKNYRAILMCVWRLQLHCYRLHILYIFSDHFELHAV